jgi:hypothetical protein
MVKAHTHGGESSAAFTDMHGVRVTPHLSTALALEGYEEESGAEASFDEAASGVSFAYDVAEHWQWHSREEWLTGAEIAGLDERVRFSTNMSHWFCWNHLHNTLRLQYDADFLPGGAVENSVWLQFVIEWREGH